MSTLNTTISNTIVKGVGDAMVDTARNLGKYNIGADYYSSVKLRVSMAELQKVTFANAQAMLANQGGLQAFNSQLRDMSSYERMRKAGYDTAEALRVSANTITTVRSVIGKNISDATAGKEADQMVSFFQQAARAGHTTVSQYADLATELSNNIDVTAALSKLNTASRTEALKDIIVTRDHAMAMGLGAGKAKEFALALAGSKQDKVAARFKAAAATVSMVSVAQSLGYQGMSPADVMEQQKLQAMGAGRTKEQDQRYALLTEQVGRARAFIQEKQGGTQFGMLGYETFLEKNTEAIEGASKYAQAVAKGTEMAQTTGLAAKSPEPGTTGSPTGSVVTAAGAMWENIRITLDGIFTKGLMSAISSLTTAVWASVAATSLSMIGLRGLPAIAGVVASGLGRIGSLVGVGGAVVGGVASGALGGYAVSSALDKEGATTSEKVGGGLGGAVVGAVGGVAGGVAGKMVGTAIGGTIGTFLGPGIGTAAGMAIGGVIGHYAGTAIGGLFNKSTEPKPEKNSTTNSASPTTKKVGEMQSPEIPLVHQMNLSTPSYLVAPTKASNNPLSAPITGNPMLDMRSMSTSQNSSYVPLVPNQVVDYSPVAITPIPTSTSAYVSSKVTQPIQRSVAPPTIPTTANGSNIESPEAMATQENTDILRSLLKAQQTQNGLMVDYIDLYRQTSETETPFWTIKRPDKEPHAQR